MNFCFSKMKLSHRVIAPNFIFLIVLALSVYVSTHSGDMIKKTSYQQDQLVEFHTNLRLATMNIQKFTTGEMGFEQMEKLNEVLLKKLDGKNGFKGLISEIGCSLAQFEKFNQENNVIEGEIQELSNYSVEQSNKYIHAISNRLADDSLKAKVSQQEREVIPGALKTSTYQHTLMQCLEKMKHRIEEKEDAFRTIANLLANTSSDEKKLAGSSFEELPINVKKATLNIQTILQTLVLNLEKQNKLKITVQNEIEEIQSRINSVSSEQTRSLFRRFEKSFKMLAWIIMASVIFTIAFNVLTANQITRPINELIEVFEKYGKGDLHARAQIDSKDEIGFFAERFNVMLDHIKKSATTLQRSESKFRELFEKMTSGVIVCEVLHQGDKLIIKDFNQAAENITEFKKDSVVGKTVLDIFPGLTGSEINEVAKKVYQTGYAIQIPEFLYEERHQNRWVEQHIYKLPSGELVILFNDITDKKTLQAETIRAGHLASIGELAAGVAHEINNPVAGILSVAEILKDKEDQLGEEMEIPSLIIQEAERISKIVKNLLSFARDNQEDFSLVQIDEVLQLALDLVDKQIAKDGIHLAVHMAPNLSEIKARSHEIQQVILNLLSNARFALKEKYPGHHENKILEITGDLIKYKGHAYVRLSFLDQGIGIPKRLMSRIVEPFFSTKDKGEGTGLGLSISHGIIKNHGGRLWFESREGEYTKVMMDLPQYCKEIKEN